MGWDNPIPSDLMGQLGFLKYPMEWDGTNFSSHAIFFFFMKNNADFFLMKDELMVLYSSGEP